MSLTAKKQEIKYEKFILEGLNCSVCAGRIVKEIDKLPEVKEVDYNTATAILSVNKSIDTHNFFYKIQEIVSEIETGVIVKRKESKKTTHLEGNKGNDDIAHSHKSSKIWKLITGSLLFVIALLSYFLPFIANKVPYHINLSLFIISYIIIGGPVVISSAKNIIKGQIFDEQFLMTIATLGAFIIGEFPEGVAVMLFYMVGEMLQDKAVAKSRRSIKELMDIKPDYANLKVNKQVKKVLPEKVNVGDYIVVRPGEKVPIDGQVVKGETLVDSSALTGESVPQKIIKGDSVLSGMINKNGLITVKTTKMYRDSTVAKILELVEEASSKKSGTEKFITKFAHYYTPIVVFAALAVAILPPLLFRDMLFKEWIYRSLIFLVISCPCALVISIPLSFFAGIGKASRQGILIKGSNYLEALRQVKRVIFDKTGTLTHGIFEVDKVKTVKNYKPEEVLTMAAIAECHSNHPIAISIVKAAKSCLKSDIVDSFEEITGYGVKVKVAGKKIMVGNSQLLFAEGIDFKEAEESGTIVYVVIDEKLEGYIVITDKVKEDAYTIVDDLKDIGVEEIVMLTGDRNIVAEEIAKELKMDEYYAQLLPQEKVDKVEEIITDIAKDTKTAFVGDGINDAPVLARSDIGIAMGGLGSDATIEAADVVLMKDMPSQLLSAIKTAKKTGKIIWQNIVFILGVKGIVLTLGILGNANMWEAVFADVGVALVAVLNSMRILNKNN